MRVAVRARNHGDSVLRASFDPQPVQIAVPIVRPRLSVGLSPEQIQGFGLESADLIVRTESGGAVPCPLGSEARDVLYAVGVNLWGVEIDARAGQAVAFVVAVAGAWFGIRALLPPKAG